MNTFLSAVAAVLLLLLTAVELYRAGIVRVNYPDEDRFPVWGIDVSHHQGAIDGPAVRENGLAFAFIKATEGATHRDTRFSENWTGAGEAGLARGAYHFFTFCTDGVAQAENFLARTAELAAELPPVADVEFAGNCKRWESVAAVRRELGRFLARVEERLGRRPLLYYTDEAAHEILDGHFHEHPRWPRSVVGEPPDETLGAWTFWQYADNARILGIRGPVDLNVFRGGRDEFDGFVRARWEEHVSPP